MNLHVVLRWMFFQVFAVVRQPCQVPGLDVLQRVRQGHLTVTMVVPVGFAIGGNVHQLVALAALVKSPSEALRKPLSGREHFFERNGLRHGRIVEEHRDFFS